MEVQAQQVILKDKNPYWIRLLDASDDVRLQNFFYSHTEETIFRRYGFMVKQMTHERALELVTVNQKHDLGLAILSDASTDAVIYAVGRYCLDPNQKSAEMAFVVAESKRRIGMAELLIEYMLTVGKNRKLSYLWAQVDRNNHAMLSLFNKYKAEKSIGEDYYSVTVKIYLSEAQKELPKAFIPFRTELKEK